MRIQLAVLLLAIACGDNGGGTSTTDTQTSVPSGTTTTTATAASTGSTSPDEPTSSGSADGTGSSTGAGTTTTTTGPDPTTGPVLTSDASTTTSTATSGDTTTTSDDTTTTSGDTNQQCEGADVAAIQAAFVECISPGYFGQTKSISGVTCWNICCAFGIFNCSHRAAQAGYDACEPNAPEAVGGCDDVFQDAWSSQCFCLN